ncbi:flavonol synthase/flavanone 3-hydroxylase-like [Gastrolobium bilobum]|uniref:flavonol synthase/flavanone 3-hydroxylase-like n=1 Tax=Gastrolobium bilobum TaxID=150636 RepID=UPI002AAFED04|nr:flavonol synthase/flavanone 3-hydroxylase-like [Gastrolobium bilobum]
MGEVDPALIQPPEHRPKLYVTEAEGIPIIDLASLSEDSNTDPSAIEGLVREIGSAFKEWGFFQVINHGVPIESREKIEATAKKFFALSNEEKGKVRRDAVNVMGYYDSEHTKNIRDWKEVFDFTVEEPTLMAASLDPHNKETTHWNNQWPENPPELREAFQEYAKVIEKLALKLMELIAMSLGLPPKRFHGFFKDQTSWIRLNYYPPCPFRDIVLGCGRHKDTGVLTVLAQDEVSGLEVKRKSDGEWVRVNPTPNAYIINLGDIMQVWTNGAYESIEHRVILNPEKARLSYPFFLKPAHYTMVEPFEELTNEQNPPKYKAYSFGKFFVTRKRSNFMKLDVENIQIYHFKI